MNKIIGLDISTKTIGFAVFEESGKLLELTHVSPKVKPLPDNKMELMFKKVNIFKDFLKKYKFENITKVIIEEPLLNSNNTYTINTLIRYNGMVSKVVFDILGIVPNFISAYDSRKYGFPELMKPRTHKKDGTPVKKIGKPVLFGEYDFKLNKKHIIWGKVADLEPQILWEYTKHNTIKKESYDRSDAYCCVLGQMKKEEIW